MNQKELLAFAKEAAKSMKTEKDLGDFNRMLKQVTVEAALGAELGSPRLRHTPSQRWLKQPQRHLRTLSMNCC